MFFTRHKTTMIEPDEALPGREQPIVVPGRHTVLGTPIAPIVDTGELPAEGGNKHASLADVTIPPTGGVSLNAEVGHAATIGQGDRSRSEASVANLDMTAGDYHITADFLMARAQAKCNDGTASVSASSEIAALHVQNASLGINQDVAVTGQANQPLTVGGVSLGVINEQPSHGSNDITVNALHVTVPNPLGGPPVADVIIASAHADITCQGQPACDLSKDFVTGGGWITGMSGDKGTFAVAGGKEQGWGHLTYIDHGAKYRVKAIDVDVYTITGPTSRHIEGPADVNGSAGRFVVDVADNGEPGHGTDSFAIKVLDAGGAVVYSAGSSDAPDLEGGNIQLHLPCK
jgi:hypothetical protein